MSTLMLGLLFGWGIGVAAMRAATASRSQVLLLAATQQVKARFVLLQSVYWKIFILLLRNCQYRSQSCLAGKSHTGADRCRFQWNLPRCSVS